MSPWKGLPGEALEDLAVLIEDLLNSFLKLLVVPARLDVGLDRGANGLGDGNIIGSSDGFELARLQLIKAQRHSLRHCASSLGRVVRHDWLLGIMIPALGPI